MRYVPSILVVIFVGFAAGFELYSTNSFDNICWWVISGLLVAWLSWPSTHKDGVKEEDCGEDDDISIKYVEDPRTGLCFALVDWGLDSTSVLVPKEKIPPQFLSTMKVSDSN